VRASPFRKTVQTVYTVSGYGASPHVRLFTDHVPVDVLTLCLGGLQLSSCYVHLVDLPPAGGSTLQLVRVPGLMQNAEGAPCLQDNLRPQIKRFCS